VEALEADVLREQAVVDALPTWRKRLRFPMLKEGETAAKRDAVREWMRANGYLPGSVSIDAACRRWRVTSQPVLVFCE
jgi:peptidoglycan-N-acetylglucosamine deacetylase